MRFDGREEEAVARTAAALAAVAGGARPDRRRRERTGRASAGTVTAIAALAAMLGAGAVLALDGTVARWRAGADVAISVQRIPIAAERRPAAVATLPASPATAPLPRRRSTILRPTGRSRPAPSPPVDALADDAERTREVNEEQLRTTRDR